LHNKARGLAHELRNGIETVGEVNHSPRIRPLKQVCAENKGVYQQEQAQQRNRGFNRGRYL